MMEFFLNESNVDQVFLIKEYREVIPSRYGVTTRRAAEYFSDPALSNNMTRFKNFIVACQHRSEGRAVLHRTSALGDVLMMMALAGSMKDAVCSFDRQRFSAISELYHPDMQNRTGIILDGEVEVDHVDSPVPLPHRVDLMARSMWFEAKTIEWKMPFEVPDQEVESFDVVVQCGGSTGMKQLHPSTLRFGMTELARAGLRVAIVGSEKTFGCPASITDLREKTTLWELWNIIKRAKVLVTHDSGTLWISHFTKTPTVLLCGPTHAESRLSRHPAETRWINLARQVGCRPCGETMARCNDVACMGLMIPLAWFSEQLQEKVGQLLENL